MTEGEIGGQLKRALRRLVWATGLLYVALIAVFAYVWIEESRATHALCALRTDLQMRVDSSNAFLAKHPHGVAGISAAEIKVSLTGQERTIKSLSNLRC